MRCPGFRHPGVPQHLRNHSPVPPPGSQRALRAIRKGIADSSVDDSRVTRFRASPTLGRTGTFFGESPVVLSLSGEGFASPGLEQDAETAHVARRPMFKTFPAGWCLRRRCGGVGPDRAIGTGPLRQGGRASHGDRSCRSEARKRASVSQHGFSGWRIRPNPSRSSSPFSLLARQGAECESGKRLSGLVVLARPAGGTAPARDDPAVSP